MRSAVVMSFVGLAVCCATVALAHGVRTEVKVGATTVVTFTHDDGEPLADTPFTVLAPRRGQPYLSGSTDRHGRVVFMPDEAGAWKVRVAGADGHGAVVTVDVDSMALGEAGADTAAGEAHDHAHDAGHDHAQDRADDHAHDHARSTPSAVRGFDAVAGLAVLVAVLAVAVLVARRRR